MSADRFREESGYSLVEVMASIMILAIAILPMVSMFDMGLNSATSGSNYDKARAFANSQLEQVKNLSYADVRDNFPIASSTPRTPSSTPPGTGNYTSSALPVPARAQLPSGSNYTVTKQYVLVPDGAAVNLANANTDQRMMRLTVTVNWSGNSYTASGIRAGGLS